MEDKEAVIKWFKDREGKVSYDMNNRLGPKSYDCSSSVFNALIYAGFLPAGTWPGTTESLYALEGSLLQPISFTEATRGDIFVSGVKGQSLFAGGHTGAFVDDYHIIHCNGYDDGIKTTTIDGRTGTPLHCYRLKSVSGGNGNIGTPPTEKINIGSLDAFEVKGDKVRISGWHYAMGAREFIFVMDKATGKELARVQAPAVNRPDVQAAYPDLAEANQTGFDVTVSVPANKQIYVIARTTDSTDGNSQYIDLPFSKVIDSPGTSGGSKYQEGQSVTLLAHATHYQTGQKIADFAKNQKYNVVQVKPVKNVNSKYAYLLSGIMSWVLEQDIR